MLQPLNTRRVAMAINDNRRWRLMLPVLIVGTVGLLAAWTFYPRFIEPYF